MNGITMMKVFPAIMLLITSIFITFISVFKPCHNRSNRIVETMIIITLALLVHEFRKGNLDVISRIGCCLLTGLTLISGVLLIIGVGV